MSSFDELDHGHLRAFLDRRVRDGVLRRTIDKWLAAGVMDGDQRIYPESGTPQGSVVSPILANVYLHEVVDRWFEEQVRPRLHGPGLLIRYADDLVMVFGQETDARRVAAVLSKRLGRFGLRLHPGKTRLLQFQRPPKRQKAPRASRPETFEFLGFTHYWGLSRKRTWVIKRKTASSRLSRSLRDLRGWCRRSRHRPLVWQHRMLASKLRGHYAYYGITSNFPALQIYYNEARLAWKKWLGRRSQRGRMTWKRFVRLLKGYPLPEPRIVRSAFRQA